LGGPFVVYAEALVPMSVGLLTFLNECVVLKNSNSIVERKRKSIQMGLKLLMTDAFGFHRDPAKIWQLKGRDKVFRILQTKSRGKRRQLSFCGNNEDSDASPITFVTILVAMLKTAILAHIVS
jgi:hypothetical protein